MREVAPVTVPSMTRPRRVVMPARLCGVTPQAEVDKVVKKGKHRQLTLEVMVSNHQVLPTQIRALVDTGAMLNIIKMGILPHNSRPRRKVP